MRWLVMNSNIARPVDDIAFLDDDMTISDLCEVLECLPWRRTAHQIVIDSGVRDYLLGVLKEHLPRFRREALGEAR